MIEKDLSPIELLVRVHLDLIKLKANGALFGRASELDIDKANKLINSVLDTVEVETKLLAFKGV